MTPTPRLRFVQRNDKVVLNGEEFDNWRTILQQWFTWDIQYPTASGEWRDVPLEKEHD